MGGEDEVAEEEMVVYMDKYIHVQHHSVLPISNEQKQKEKQGQKERMGGQESIPESQK